jgi:hypothetical protein
VQTGDNVGGFTIASTPWIPISRVSESWAADSAAAGARRSDQEVLTVRWLGGTMATVREAGLPAT